MPVDLSRVPAFYHTYINQVKDTDLTTAFAGHQETLINQLKEVPEEMWGYRYAEGKWSIKELVQHIIDAERIFCYRALCIARKDKTNLPSFEESSYAEASEADRRSKQDLLNELNILQRSSALLFASFSDEQLNESGIVNGKSIYVEGIGFIIVGHVLHHLNILNERYLIKKPSA